MKRQLKRQFVWFALALSVLFNVFFAAGYMKATTEAAGLTDPDRAVKLVARELDLDDRQTAAFASLRLDVSGDDEAYRNAIALAEQELIAELDRPQPDRGRVREIVASKSDLMEQRRLAGTDRLCEFVGMLRPDQRRQIFRRMHRGPHGEDRRQKLLSRFDADGDGVLSATERAEARTAFETKRSERRARMLEQFDQDGDGTLNDAEREAFRTWRMEHHGEGPGDRGGRRGGG